MRSTGEKLDWYITNIPTFRHMYTELIALVWGIRWLYHKKDKLIYSRDKI